VASGVVVLTALLTRLARNSVAAGCSRNGVKRGRRGWLAVEVIGQNMRKYSSSSRVNLCVAATRGLSPEIGRGSGEWTKVAGAIGVWVTGYSSLNVDGTCIRDSVHGVSNRECTSDSTAP